MDGLAELLVEAAEAVHGAASTTRVAWDEEVPKGYDEEWLNQEAAASLWLGTLPSQ